MDDWRYHEEIRKRDHTFMHLASLQIRFFKNRQSIVSEVDQGPLYANETKAAVLPH